MKFKVGDKVRVREDLERCKTYADMCEASPVVLRKLVDE